MTCQRVRGTEDFLDLRLQDAVFTLMKKHFEHHNFHPIMTPHLEYTSLFVRPLGEATDVVTKEMYTFPAREGEESISLRPELTAPIIRAFLENGAQATPWKVYACGSAFRYERPQKGRWREFQTLSLEVVGVESIAHDVALIKMLNSLYRDVLKVPNYTLKINFLGTKEDRVTHKTALRAYLDTLTDRMCQTCIVRKDKNILRVFDCKNETCKKLYEIAPKITDFLSELSAKEWEMVKSSFEMLGVAFVHDPMLVRGLDYYAKTVFEFVSTDLGSQSAFCGGGRYEIAQALGARDPVPSVGAGIGIGRLLMILDQHKGITLPEVEPLVLVLPFTEAQQSLGLMLHEQIVNAGFRSDVLLDNPSVKSLMRKADKMAAAYVVLVGEDEQKNKTAVVKNMKTGESKTVAHTHIAETLKSF